jgi:outer membrane protein assembly factor BamA
MTYALRGQGRVSFGDEGQRYYAGGAFSLRGYPHRSVVGRRLFLLNQEIRFPLVQRLLLAMPTGAVDLPVFYGSCFADVAWTGDPAWIERPYGSVGVGFFVGGGPYPRLRVDLSWPTDFHNFADHPDTEFSVGFGY